MRGLFCCLMLCIGIALAIAQGGQGGFAGGAAQGGQGGRQAEYDRSVQAIENAIGTYLNSDELKSILTPGEHVEWSLDLKPGQVVVAESRSDAFDPALEIVQGRDKVLASNDDRYPGDQRPLLLWRCQVAGTYALRARSFMNKAGGQCFTRFTIYDTMDLVGDQMEERDFDKHGPFLLLFRVPMKAGQIKRIMVERPTPRHMGATLRQKISPIGLPDIDLAGPLSDITGDLNQHVRGPNVIMAPVDGDYYIFADAWGSDNARIRAAALPLSGESLASPAAEAKAATDTPALWTLPVKAGDFVEVAAPQLHLHARLIVAETPDISKYDLSKPETNPFFPRLKKEGEDKGPAFEEFPARGRDPRIMILLARRDTKLWIATNGAGPDRTEYTVTVRPAAKAFPDGAELGAPLRVGNTDYWAFNAKIGDVMTLNSSATSFAQHLVLRDPDQNQIWDMTAAPDQATQSGLLVITKPGRYLTAISCLGDGGSGPYTLSRRVFPSKVFGKGKPAEGEIGDGQVQVWKVTVQANDPVLIHWNSSEWTYSISVYQEDGARAGLPLTKVDGHTTYGILKVDKTVTYTIVLNSTGKKAQYSIELSDLPGYKKGG